MKTLTPRRHSRRNQKGAISRYAVIFFVSLALFVYFAFQPGWFWTTATLLTALATLSVILPETLRERKLARYWRSQAEAILAHYGPDPDAREQGIQKAFDEATLDINVSDFGYVADTWDVTAAYSKNIGAMQPTQREALRIAYLLLNRGLIDHPTFFAARAAIVYDQANAVIRGWKFHSELKTAPEAITRLFQWRGIQTPQAGESRIRGVLDALYASNPGHPTVRMLKARVTGGSAWLSPDEVSGTVLDGQGGRGLFLGRFEDGAADAAYTGEGSLITIGRSGTGKSQCHAIPNLLRWPTSAVVLDIKGELFKATSAQRAKAGPVIRFSPFEKLTARYNPLAFLPSDPHEAWTEAQFLASMLHPEAAQGGNARHWEFAAREILTAVITFVALTNPPDHRSFTELLDILSGKDWDRFMKGLTELASKHGLAPAARTAASFAEEDAKAPKQFVASRTSAYMAVNGWSNPDVEEATQVSDWSPEDLHGQKPLTVYITATPQQLTTQNALFRTILGQHVHMLLKEKFLNAPNPILFLIDEFPALGKMQPLADTLTLGRQYGLRLWLMAQYVDQVIDTYGNDGILKASAVRSYLNPDFPTAKLLSEEVGERAGALDGSRQPLVTPQDLTGPAFQDLILIMAAGTKPAKVHKIFAYRDEPFAGNIGSITPAQAMQGISS